MLLEENEIQAALEQAKIAFPNFDNWQYNNEVDKKMGHYDGFCLWGEFAIFDNGGEFRHYREDSLSPSRRIRKPGPPV